MPDISDGSFWNELDPDNNKAPPNGWPEGMMPSGVNDAARMNMGALKRFWNRANPVQVINGSAGLYQFTTGNPAYPASYVEGEAYTFIPGTASVGGDQFQVNGLGALPIYTARAGGLSAFAPVVANEMVPSSPAWLTYDGGLNAGAGGFVLHNPYRAIISDGAGGISLPGTVTAANIVTSGAVNAATGTVGGVGFPGAGQVNATVVNASQVSAGSISATGPSAALNFYDRTTNLDWLWYSTGNIARLWSNGDKVLVDTGGNMTLEGNSLHLGGTGGGVNGSGGAIIYGDSNNIVIKTQGGTLFQNVNGTNVASFDGSGDFSCAAISCGNINTGGGGVTTAAINCGGGINCGSLQANSNIAAQGALFAGGCEWYNSGGWMRTPNPLWTDSDFHTAGNVNAGSANIGGGLSVGGSVNSSGVFGRNGAGALIECFPGGGWSEMSFTIISGGYFAISPDGGGSGFNYAPNGSWSDRRLKENIEPTPVDALAAILATPVHSFDFNEDGRKRMPSLPAHIPIGLIAQEVEETMPHVVHTLPELDDKMMIRDHLITPYLIRALQQLAERVATLEAK